MNMPLRVDRVLLCLAIVGAATASADAQSEQLEAEIAAAKEMARYRRFGEAIAKLDEAAALEAGPIDSRLRKASLANVLRVCGRYHFKRADRIASAERAIGLYRELTEGESDPRVSWTDRLNQLECYDHLARELAWTAIGEPSVAAERARALAAAATGIELAEIIRQEAGSDSSREAQDARSGAVLRAIDFRAHVVEATEDADLRTQRMTELESLLTEELLTSGAGTFSATRLRSTYARALWASGRVGDARDVFDALLGDSGFEAFFANRLNRSQANALGDACAEVYSALAKGHNRRGQHEFALQTARLLREFLDRHEKSGLMRARPEQHMQLQEAIALAGLGRTEEAVAILEKLKATRDAPELIEPASALLEKLSEGS